MTTVTDTVAVDRLQPDHIGIVLDEGIETWDSVDDATAKQIARAIVNAGWSHFRCRPSQIGS